MGYTFYSSQGGEYSLGEVNIIRKMDFSIDLSTRLGDPYALKIHEALAFGVSSFDDFSDFEQFSRNSEDNRWIISSSNYIMTEIPYERDGRLMAFQTTMPNGEKRGLFPVASFSKREGELLFTIHPYQQLGVNPQFLYDFAAEHGRRIN